MNRLKSSSDNVTSVVDEFFDQMEPKTATPIEELCQPQERLC